MLGAAVEHLSVRDATNTGMVGAGTAHQLNRDFRTGQLICAQSKKFAPLKPYSATRPVAEEYRASPLVIGHAGTPEVFTLLPAAAGVHSRNHILREQHKDG